MSLVKPIEGTERRHALILGTAHNATGWADISQGVYAELDRAERLLRELLGYDDSTFRRVVDPTESELKKVAARWRAEIAPGADDWMLVYYTGHGIEHAGTLRLITRDVETDLVEAAPTAQDLVASLLGGAEMPRHLLLILDTCQSAAAHLDSNAVAARISESTGGAARGSDFQLVCTTRSIDLAFVGRFMEGLERVLSGGAVVSPDEEYAPLATVIAAGNRFLENEGLKQRASLSGAGESEARFLPNPRWVPQLRVVMTRERRARVLHRLQVHALASHWDPRSRGVSTPHDVGWLFTGRARVLRCLVRWLAEGREQGLVIRGWPGSGKSAVLARLATLADPAQRQRAIDAGALADVSDEEMPPIDAFDVAVHARGKDSQQVALEIAAALDLDLSGGGDPERALGDQLAKRTAATTTFLIDALDEAKRPEACAHLLRGLARSAPRLRMLVGVREAGETTGRLTEILGTEFAHAIDLDHDDWLDPDDVARYVERCLLHTVGSPYVDIDTLAVRRLAKAVAARAGTSFLVASATAHSLAARKAAVGEGEVERLPSTVSEAFDFDLERYTGFAGDDVRAFLTALACGEGQGLPEAEWMLIAGAIARHAVARAELESVSQDAAFYVAKGEEFGAPVRYLYHKSFAEYLRKDVTEEQEQNIASKLLEAVPTPRMGTPVWQLASEYTLAYCPKHLWRARSFEPLRWLVLDRNWFAEQQRRFGELTRPLADVDLAIDLARRQRPPDLLTIVKCCAVYGRVVTTAPPIVIDVLAGLGQRARAQLMADAIEFPLDRCHALSMLAARHAAASDTERARACIRAAERAAGAVHGHFQTMALHWVVDKALATGFGDVAERVGHKIRAAIAKLLLGLHEIDAASWSGRTGHDDWSRIASLLWGTDQLSEADRMFALPHWLFWAAMSLRRLGDAEGLAQIGTALRDIHPRWNNLTLQTAAVSGAADMLRALEAKDVFEKPANLALALIEAGLVERFDALRVAGVFDGESMPYDARKRYSWALARRGDIDAALLVAAKIGHLEERARALERIAQTARAGGTGDVLDRVVESAGTLLKDLAYSQRRPPRAAARPKSGVRATPLAKKAAAKSVFSEPVPSWRVECWLAQVMLLAGRKQEAERLAEAVCDANIASSHETCLALATPYTARSKNHVHLEQAAGPDVGLRETVRTVIASAGIDAGIQHLFAQDATPHSRATILAEIASEEIDVAAAFEHWLSAVIESRTAGLPTLRDVIRSGADLLGRSNVGLTADSLLSAQAEL